MYFKVDKERDKELLLGFMEKEGMIIDIHDNPYPFVVDWEVSKILKNVDTMEGINNMTNFILSEEYIHLQENTVWIENNVNPMIEEYMISVIDSNPKYYPKEEE